MLSISNISYSINGRHLLNGVSLTIFNEKKALIGENGSGKTTLLEIITGNLLPEAGKIEIKGSYAYIPQEVKAFDKKGLEEIESAFAEAKKVEEKLQEFERKHKFDEEYAHLLEKYGEIDGYNAKHLILEKLNEFELDLTTVEKPFREMSGGERTKCLIVKSLLMNPDLLIIDEPTNHLDVETIELLEKYLIGFKGSILLVTHDKTLINNIAGSILSLEEGVIKEYPGNYEEYRKIKENQDRYMRKERERLLKFIEKNRFFIEKFRYGTRSTQAKSREKMLEKIEVPEVKNGHKLEINIESSKRGGEKVVEVKDLRKKYEKNEVLKGLNLNLFRGDRLGIIGRNGSGKSTLLKILAGEIDEYEGSVRLFESIDVAYFPQDAFLLNEDNTILDEFLKEGLTVTEARTFLGSFNFGGEDVFKKISSLSGGEKRRLIVAKISLIKGNFLLLDEPTNHLDIPSKEAVIDALSRFEGTILIVTHDREILREIAKKIYYLEDGILKDKERRENIQKNNKETEKEKNKIKARIEYLERVLKEAENEKKQRELKILRRKLKNM